MNSFIAILPSPPKQRDRLGMINTQCSAMKDFRKLKLWVKAHELVLAVYQTTASFPRDETYGLTTQIRRCASSIPSNIAEGCGRDGGCRVSPLLSDRPR